MFKPQAIYYENGIEGYELGKELMEKYKDVIHQEGMDLWLVILQRSKRRF